MKNIKIDNKIINSLSLVLKDFSFENNPEKITHPKNGFRILPQEFPVPQLIYFLLSKIFTGYTRHRLEKTLWTVSFYYKGFEAEFALQKLGLRLYLSDLITDSPEREQIKNQILSKIKKATSILDRKVLTEYAKKQIIQGDVTIDNQYVKFSNMYYYFREQAKEAFNGKGDNSQGAQKVFGIDPNKFQLNLIGFYNTSAMIDTYFSRLEHLLVISLPFLKFNPEKINLLEFISTNWGNKFKLVFNVKNDNKAKSFYDKLKVIKEKYRNTFSHGGFEKEGASLFFHLPEVGAITASLSKFDKSPHFNFFPIEINTFEEVCKLFDDFDKWLEKNTLPFAVKYANSGLEVSFDKNSVSEYNTAMESEYNFNQLIEKKGYYSDMFTNMDF